MKQIIYLLPVALIGLLIAACNKPAADKPISEVKQEAASMDVDSLKETAMEYKDAIADKMQDLEALQAKLKDIPMSEMLGQEAEKIKTDLQEINDHISSLRQQLNVYLDKLREHGADISGLAI